MIHYYHSDCGGKVGILSRKCSKCGKKWPFKVLFQYPLPNSLYIYRKGEMRLKKGSATYSKWADKYPQVSAFARRLPKWPRWLRIATTLAIVAIVVLVIYLIRR